MSAEEETETIFIRTFAELNNLKLVSGRGVVNSFPRHVHATYCLGIVDRGARRFRYRGTSIVFPAGSAFIINPGEPHACGTYEDTGHDYRVLCIDSTIMQAIASEMCGRPRGLPYFPNITLRDTDLFDQISDFCKVVEYSDSMPVRDSIFRSLLSDLVSGYSDISPPAGWPCVARRSVRQVCEYINENYGQDFSLQDLAGLVNLSPFHFSRVFSQETGMTPHAYLIQVRVKKAQRDLLKGMPIADVAYGAGFTDQSHFTRFFKKIVGITPGRYVRAYAKQKHIVF